MKFFANVFPPQSGLLGGPEQFPLSTFNLVRRCQLYNIYTSSLPVTVDVERRRGVVRGGKGGAYVFNSMLYVKSFFLGQLSQHPLKGLWGQNASFKKIEIPCKWLDLDTGWLK